MTRFFAWVGRVGNRLPHPLWLFVYLILGVLVLSAVAYHSGLSVHLKRGETFLFRVDRRHSKDLDSGIVTAELRKQFSKRKSVISGKSIVEIKNEGSKWLLKDQYRRKQYYITRVGKQLHVSLKSIDVVNILSAQGLRDFVTNMVDYFAQFAPLALVMIMIIGVSVAEHSGFLETLIKTLVRKAPEALVIPVIIVAGACGNIGSDAGIVIVPPLAAMLFKKMGRNPLAGLVLGYAAATAGFTANLIPAGTDVLLASISTEAAQSTGKDLHVSVTSNYYFMIASTFMLAIVGTWVVRKYTIPEVGESQHIEGEPRDSEVTPTQKKALYWALAVGGIYMGIMLMTILPADGILRHPDPNKFTRSPFFKGLIPILFFLFVFCGYTYGKIAGTIKKSGDLSACMVKGTIAIAPFLVLCLAIAHFIQFFQYSNLDQIIAFYGAAYLKILNLPMVLLLCVFLVMALFVNLFIGSGSAKWALFAPIFIPMFHQLDIAPAEVQLVYRIGDSTTNGISPCYTMFPLILGWIMQYKKDAGIGTVFSLLLPYTIFFGISWIALFVIWSLLGLPIGIN